MSSDIVRGGNSGSALSDLLRNSTVYERAGAVMPRDLVQFGMYGSGAMVITGLLALVFPSPHAIAQGSFFLVLGGLAAGLVALLHSLAVPAILIGIVLFAMDLYLMEVPTSEHWRAAIVGQALAGSTGGALATLFLALLILNLALWIVIVACVAALGFALLGALLSG